MPRRARTINSINFEIESTKFQIWERKKGPEVKMFDKETARNGNSCSRGNFKSCECTPCRNFLFLSSFPRANSLVFWFVKKKKTVDTTESKIVENQTVFPKHCAMHGCLNFSRCSRHTTNSKIDDLTWLAYKVCHSDSQSAD